MSIQSNKIGNVVLMIFSLIVLYSCVKQNEIVTLPIDKLYIIEYRYTISEEHGESGYNFYVGGFCELDKDYNVKYSQRILYKSNNFYSSVDIIPDSLRSKISNTLLKYQADTTFFYQGGLRVYNGNKYRIIIQKCNLKDVTIKFEPEFLPEDLKFVYSYLYENRKKTEDKTINNELLEMFEKNAKDDILESPPLEIKTTLKFTSP